MRQATLNLNLSAKKTRKQVFLGQIEQVTPWDALVELIVPYYPEGKTSRPPFSLSTMPRVHFMQQWFSPLDPAMEEAFFGTPLYREFVQLEVLGRLSDERTILHFRHRLDKHKLAQQILTTVNELLIAKDLLLKVRVVVDATLIAAPTSTQGNSLLHGEEVLAFGDAGYQCMERRPDATGKVTWHIAMRLGKRRLLDKENEADAAIEQAEKPKAAARAKVAQPLREIKRQFGYVKVRYRGLRKNTAQLIALPSASAAQLGCKKVQYFGTDCAEILQHEH